MAADEERRAAHAGHARGVGAQEHDRSGLAAAEDSDDAGVPDFLGHLDAVQVEPGHLPVLPAERERDFFRAPPVAAADDLYKAPMHPYTAAKMVASIGHLYGRQLYLNLIAGGFKNDLNALNDPTPHDERYARLLEYTTLVLDLLKTSGPATRAGRYYTVTNLKMPPPLPPGWRRPTPAPWTATR